MGLVESSRVESGRVQDSEHSFVSTSLPCMNKTSIAREFLAAKTNDPAALREHLGGTDRAFAKVLVALLESPEKRAKNRAAKLLALTSEKKPGAVYPDIDRLFEYLAGDETILKWNALISLGHLAGVDKSNCIEERLPVLFQLLHDESMITAGHAIVCLGRIAAAHQALTGTIVVRLLSIESMPHSAECRRILAGKVLGALDPAYAHADDATRKRLRSFAKRHLKNARPATQKLATRCWRRWQD